MNKRHRILNKLSPLTSDKMVGDTKRQNKTRQEMRQESTLQLPIAMQNVSQNSAANLAMVNGRIAVSEDGNEAGNPASESFLFNDVDLGHDVVPPNDPSSATAPKGGVK